MERNSGELPASLVLEDKPIELGWYLGVLIRRWRAVAYTAGAVFLAVLFYNVLRERVYEATTTVQIGQARALAFFDELDVFRPKADPVLSEVEILRSRTIAEGAVRGAGLQVRYLDPEVPPASLLKEVDAHSSLAGRIGTLEVLFPENRPGTDPTSSEDSSEDPENDREAARYRISYGDEGVVASGIVGKPAKGRLFSGTLPEVPPFREPVKFRLLPLQQVAEDLRERTTVSLRRSTNVAEVVVTAATPEAAAIAANAIADSYYDHTVKRQRGQAVTTADFLEKKIEEVRTRLAESERSLKEYKEEKSLLTLSEKARGYLDQWTRKETARATLETQREHARAVLERLEAGGGSADVALISTAGVENPVLVELSANLAQLELERAQLSEGFAPGHSSIRALDARIERARAKLVEELRATLATLEEAEKASRSVLRGYDEQMKELPEAEYELARRLRQAKVNGELFTLLQEKREEARIAANTTIGTAWQVDPAVPNPTPIAPKVFRNFVFGILLGALFGVGLALLREHLDRSIRSVGDVESRLGLATFALIPEIDEPQSSPKAASDKRSRRGSNRAAKLIHNCRFRSFAAEAYRSLRTNIEFATPKDTKTPCFLMTSAGPGEGKSLTCANLAVTVSLIGRRVLVVDADMRRPVQHRLFRLERGAGLSEVLAGKRSFQDAMQRTDVEGLDLLSGGHLPPNPAELLASDRWRELRDEVFAKYDLVLVDSPPVIPFTDATVLGSRVDGTFLVLRSGKTVPEAAQRARVLLESVGTRMLGAILNGVSVEEGLGLPGYYRYYEGYYGEGDDQDGEPSRDSRWRRPLQRWKKAAKDWLDHHERDGEASRGSRWRPLARLKKIANDSIDWLDRRRAAQQASNGNAEDATPALALPGPPAPEAQPPPKEGGPTTEEEGGPTEEGARNGDPDGSPEPQSAGAPEQAGEPTTTPIPTTAPAKPAQNGNVEDPGPSGTEGPSGTDGADKNRSSQSAETESTRRTSRPGTRKRGGRKRRKRGKNRQGRR